MTTNMTSAWLQPEQSSPSLLKDHHHGILTIGKFDGMHRGHQALINQTTRLAKKQSRPSLILTFNPHPAKYFRPDDPLFLLSPRSTKRLVTKALGIDALVFQNFNQPFTDLSAEQFVSDYLLRKFNPAQLVVGADFRFGARRKGNVGLLQKICRNHGIEVVCVESQENCGEQISSSAVRRALEAGDCKQAQNLLGYRYIFQGKVESGERVGRELGYPTANISTSDGFSLQEGVYAVRCLVQSEWRNGVASWGRKPQFIGKDPVFEVHIFNFSGDIYGHHPVVQIEEYIRPQQVFGTVVELVSSIAADCEKARSILQSSRCKFTPLDERLMSLALGLSDIDLTIYSLH